MKRGTCKNCGLPIFWKLLVDPSTVFPLGGFWLHRDTFIEQCAMYAAPVEKKAK